MLKKILKNKKLGTRLLILAICFNFIAICLTNFIINGGGGEANPIQAFFWYNYGFEITFLQAVFVWVLISLFYFKFLPKVFYSKLFKQYKLAGYNWGFSFIFFTGWLIDMVWDIYIILLIIK
jgi:hypothetical protein